MQTSKYIVNMHELKIGIIFSVINENTLMKMSKLYNYIASLVKECTDRDRLKLQISVYFSQVFHSRVICDS